MIRRRKVVMITDADDNLLGTVPIKRKDYKMMKKHAASQGMTVDEYIKDVIKSVGKTR